jgi:arginyl-tRNA synthetase
VHEPVLQLLREAVERVLEGLGAGDPTLAQRVALGPARSREHGDLASNVALLLAKPLGLPPRELAERILAELRDPDGLIDRAEVAGPGFLNIFLAGAQWHALVERALAQGDRYGHRDVGGGERVQVEFVSANPTGPLTIGHGRNAVVGDVLASLLSATGHAVAREYYFNDGGRQMRVLAQSLRARYEQQLGRPAELPEDGYQGDYLVEVAQALVAEHADTWLEQDEDAFRERAQTAIFADIQATLARLSINFDSYYNERSLYDEGLVPSALEDLRTAGLVYEGEGAVWLRATDFGLDRDRVLVRSSGEPTYLLPDIAYHREKFRRGFERVIDVLGPDHIEQFPYVRAALGALGHEVERIECVIYQWVNLRSQGELVKMSTRKASFVTVDEVLDEVGPDVFRYFMIERRADTHLDFDLDLARDGSERNPVFKIQYAHARLCSIERKAAELGIEPGTSAAALEPLDSPAEKELALRVGRFPETVEQAAREREPQIVARYLLDLATAFHSYVSDARRHRVLSDDLPLSRARLALSVAVRCTLANGLALLGVSAPERM